MSSCFEQSMDLVLQHGLSFCAPRDVSMLSMTSKTALEIVDDAVPDFCAYVEENPLCKAMLLLLWIYHRIHH